MFTMLQEFVQAVVGNSMLLMVVVAIPVGAGALVFYVLAREPVHPDIGGSLGRLSRGGRRQGHRVHHRKGAGVANSTHSPDPGPPELTGVQAVASAPVGHVTFIDPFQDEDADEVYELDDIEADLEAEDGPDSVDTLSN